MPELPESRRKRFGEQYGLCFADASQLVSERSLADYYEAAAEASGNPRATANWIRSELLRELEQRLSAADSPVPAQDLGALVRMIDEGKISGSREKTFWSRCSRLESRPNDRRRTRTGSGK